MTDTTIVEPQAPAIDEGWEWAIVEVFGHRRHVGKAREEEKFGAKLCRIDVPTLGPGEGEITWSSHYYGGSSIFSYTPTDEKTVMRYAEVKRATPAAIPYRDHGVDDDEPVAEDRDDDFGQDSDFDD
jgi:hypothetical protein